MLTFLWLMPLLLILSILPFLSEKKALMLYLLGALVFPYFHLGGLFIRFEMFYAIWLTIVLLMKMLVKSDGKLYWSSINSLYSLFFMVILTSTLIAYTQHSGQLFAKMVTLYGLLRPLLILFIFMNVGMNDKFVKSVLWNFIFLSFGINLFSLLQFFGFNTITKITRVLYSSPVITPIPVMEKIFGFLARSVGVFESPVYNANYTLIVILVALNMLQEEKKKRLRWVLFLATVFAISAGISTLSGTFWLGLFVVLVIIACSSLYSPKKFFYLTYRGIIIGVIVIFVAFPVLFQNPYLRGNLNYQFNRIKSLQVFSSRYSPETGIFSRGTYAVILGNPIIGLGVTEVEGAFIGDSVYTSIFYRGGIVGFTLFLFLFYLIIKKSKANRHLPNSNGLINNLVLQITILLLLTSIGGPSFYIRRLMEWYWALVGIILNRNFKNSMQVKYHEEQGGFL